MKIKIEDGCIGCGLCVGTCSTVFRMTEENLAEVFASLSHLRKPPHKRRWTAALFK